MKKNSNNILMPQLDENDEYLCLVQNGRDICYMSYRDDIGRKDGDRIIKAVNNHDKLVQALERIERMSPNTGRDGCTYGDTDYDSQSVVFGYNLALEEIQSDIRKVLSELKKQ